MIITVILVVTAALIALFTYHLRRLKLYKAAAKFPGPKTWPLIGNADLFFGDGEKILNSVNDLTNNFTSLLRVWLANQLVFIVYDPEHIKAVVNSPKTLEKASMYEFGFDWMGTGLITSPVQKWKKRRKMIGPTFNQRILESFVPVFDEQSKILVEQMSGHAKTAGEFEIFNYVSLSTLDMICETTMGVSMKAQLNQNCQFAHVADELLRILSKRIFNFWLHPDFIFNNTKYGRRQKECIEYLHNFTDEVIQKKKAQFERSKNGHVQTRSNGTMRKAFLDLLIELNDEGGQLTDKDFRDEVNTMIFAGNDASATTVTFLLLIMANYPEIQNNVHEEITDIFAQKGSEVGETLSHKDLSKLVYLERVIKETLRIFTMGPLIARSVTEDFELDGKILPKGSTIALACMATHRDQRYWPDPLKFDPDRFLPEEIAKRDPYAFVVFSGGPRNCIGLNYAMLSMKTLLANILKKYVIKPGNKVTPIEDIRLKMDLFLRPVELIKIRIERRSQ